MTFPSTTNLTMYELAMYEPVTVTSWVGIVDGKSFHPENEYPSFAGTSLGIIPLPADNVSL